MTEDVDRSYRELLRVPNLGRVLLSMQIARIAQSMVGVALVLFTLDRYGSAPFAGLVTFASVFPGLLIAPIAGALLDRHGRLRLVLLDYVVAMAAMALIAVLAVVDVLPGPLLVLIAIVSSLTSILGHVGLRSLFPVMVPEPLWERVNAVDSNGYVIASIVGPPIAAALVGIVGGPVALLAIGVAFGIAAAALVGVPDPAGTIETTGRVLADAWAGVRYTWNNRTLRGLGFSITFGNLCHGMIAIVLPLIILQRFELEPAVVGLVFAASGISGVISSFAFGRMDTRGREWALLVWPMVALVPTIAILLLALRRASVWVGMALVASSRSSSSACSSGHSTSRSSRFASGGLIRPGWVVRSRSRWPSTTSRAVRRCDRRTAGGGLDRARHHRPRDRGSDALRAGRRVPRPARGHCRHARRGGERETAGGLEQADERRRHGRGDHDGEHRRPESDHHRADCEADCASVDHEPIG